MMRNWILQTLKHLGCEKAVKGSERGNGSTPLVVITATVLGAATILGMGHLGHKANEKIVEMACGLENGGGTDVSPGGGGAQVSVAVSVTTANGGGGNVTRSCLPIANSGLDLGE